MPVLRGYRLTSLRLFCSTQSGFSLDHSAGYCYSCFIALLAIATTNNDSPILKIQNMCVSSFIGLDADKKPRVSNTFLGS
ncbi:hypothetical protein P175DRAFT_0500597 [Aspergillus ochraceoroseus IBT 24754]|uniref:Uncharacterized protein n=1 Tax=Aspergillus ochraceoroseus IBT 24754 TaxID=1392256 RepID=A0A2T5LZK5_9EURO|nr:uncharacterized protein P175DRAFT_0500597 [Aspergillus ochraceoroseus IBT 24754]PTU21717.1 hypothetical protein P175DRAFT_0500597 [Aspergillus ochraceoroseus IBT 24754]